MIAGIFFVLIGIFGWTATIAVLVSWLALCFGTVVLGIVLLFFAPYILILPLAIGAPLSTGFFMIGLDLLSRNDNEQKITAQRKQQKQQALIKTQQRDIETPNITVWQEQQKQQALIKYQQKQIETLNITVQKQQKRIASINKPEENKEQLLTKLKLNKKDVSFSVDYQLCCLCEKQETAQLVSNAPVCGRCKDRL